MPTWCTFSLNPGHLTKESAPRDSSLGVKAALQCLSYFGSWGLAQSWCSKFTVRIGEGGISKPTSVRGPKGGGPRDPGLCPQEQPLHRHPMYHQVSVPTRGAAEAGGGEGLDIAPQPPIPGLQNRQPHVIQLRFQCGLTSEASGSFPTINRK